MTDNERARLEGAMMADKVFQGRARNGQKGSEAHLREAELAALLAAAFERGAKYGRHTAQGAK